MHVRCCMWGAVIEMWEVRLTTENSRASIFNATSLHGWSTEGAAGGDDGDCGTVVDGGDGDGGGGEGDDGGGGKLGGGSSGSATAIVMVGASSTVTPSAVEAASAVPRVDESEVSTTSGVKENIAAIAGVDKSFVTIDVAAASVRITATIAVPASLTLDVVETSLSSTLGTADAASTALGVTVEEAPTITIAVADPLLPPPSFPPPPSSPSPPPPSPLPPSTTVPQSPSSPPAAPLVDQPCNEVALKIEVA